MEGNAWGPVGKGVVLVDFDTRQALSLNEWGTPASLMPHNPYTVWQDGEDPAVAPLKALGARPDQWNRVEIEFTPVSILGRPGKEITLTMDQLLPANAGVDDFMQALTIRRTGMLDLGKHGSGHANFHYLPEGWVQHDDLGKEMPEWLIERLEALLEQGWPAPHWESMDSYMESSELPLDAGQIQEMLDEDGDDDWVREMTGLGKRYLALKQRWAGPAATPAAGPKP